MSAYKIEAGTAQHIGSRPQQNDRVALFTTPKAPGYVLAVLADGVSGGAVGSDQLLHTAKQLFDEYRAADVANLTRLQDLLREIAHDTHQILVMNPLTGASEPQSTMVLLMLTPQRQIVWAVVGDSRLYRFSNKECVARSNDADYIAHLILRDGLPEDAARKHRSSKLLANVLGNKQKEPFVTVGVQEELKAGDAFLLCSDGLWSYFTDAELATVVAKKSPREASEMLINKARERAQGKGDNCSMAILKLVAPPKEEVNYTVQKLRKAV
ncbi:PP2C family protein-serine/threonine phosphatase [Pseudoduganella sp. RAF53_2]|uniref:PP2C family protein-serine/threonine phosphatase n=1 Tax=unclassified Pseudoduganella TaxID=2637179 RepID=UPI003F9CB4FA